MTIQEIIAELNEKLHTRSCFSIQNHDEYIISFFVIGAIVYFKKDETTYILMLDDNNNWTLESQPFEYSYMEDIESAIERLNFEIANEYNYGKRK